MPTILHIESSTKVCSICIAKDGAIIAIRESEDEQYTHAEKLAVFVDEVIKEIEAEADQQADDLNELMKKAQEEAAKRAAENK